MLNRITNFEPVKHDPDALAIARLYLEKLEKLDSSERKIYRDMLALLMNPSFIATVPCNT